MYSASRATICSRNRLMSESSATWNSLMNSAQVVCMDQRVTSPSRMLNFRTNSITVLVRSTTWDVWLTCGMLVPYW